MVVSVEIFKFRELSAGSRYSRPARCSGVGYVITTILLYLNTIKSTFIYIHAVYFYVESNVKYTRVLHFQAEFTPELVH